jgi:hypothetical protein
MDVIWCVTAVTGAIGINLIASELFAWGPRFSECLMRCAVRRLAPEMQDRMQEEWAGHLQTIPLGLWRIVEAAGFYIASRQINIALRVRERQENPEKNTLQERVSGKFEGRGTLSVNINVVQVGMWKADLLTNYLKYYDKNKDLFQYKDGFKELYSSDEPEPPSKPTPPKR